MSEWISVKDRLPELPANTQFPSVNVLVAWDRGVAEMCYTAYLGAKTENGRAPRFKWHGTNSPWTITHWMPLPEPPASVEQEEPQV